MSNSRRSQGVAKGRVCILAPGHRHDDIRVFHKEATTLVQLGYQVVLYARAPHRASRNGVEVMPVRYRTRLRRFLLQPWLLYRALRDGAPLVHLHNPETLLIGLVLKLARRRVIYDTHENFPLLLPSRHWIPPLFRRPVARLVAGLEKIGGLVFDAVLVTQLQQVERFGHRAVLVANPPLTEGPVVEEAYRLAERIGRGPELRLVYAGSMSEDRGLFLMVQALEQLNRRLPARLWLAGPESQPGSLNAARRLAGWQHVDYLGELTQQQAFAHIAAADIGLVLFLDRGDNSMVNPNKLFEYLFFGTPFVASDFADWRGFMQSVEAGVFIDPGSTDQVVNALEELARDTQKRSSLARYGRAFIREHFNWESEAAKLAAVYERLSRIAHGANLND